MVPHVCLCTIQQSFKFQAVRIPIGDNISHLAHYSGKYEDANQVADNSEYVSENRMRTNLIKSIIAGLQAWFIKVFEN